MSVTASGVQYYRAKAIELRPSLKTTPRKVTSEDLSRLKNKNKNADKYDTSLWDPDQEPIITPWSRVYDAYELGKMLFDACLALKNRGLAKSQQVKLAGDIWLGLITLDERFTRCVKFIKQARGEKTELEIISGFEKDGRDLWKRWHGIQDDVNKVVTARFEINNDLAAELAKALFLGNTEIPHVAEKWSEDVRSWWSNLKRQHRPIRDPQARPARSGGEKQQERPNTQAAPGPQMQSNNTWPGMYSHGQPFAPPVYGVAFPLQPPGFFAGNGIDRHITAAPLRNSYRPLNDNLLPKSAVLGSPPIEIFGHKFDIQSLTTWIHQWYIVASPTEFQVVADL